MGGTRTETTRETSSGHSGGTPDTWLSRETGLGRRGLGVRNVGPEWYRDKSHSKSGSKVGLLLTLTGVVKKGTTGGVVINKQL